MPKKTARTKTKLPARPSRPESGETTEVDNISGSDPYFDRVESEGEISRTDSGLFDEPAPARKKTSDCPLRNAAQDMLAEHERYQSSDDEYPRVEYWDYVDSLVETFQTYSIPPNMKIVGHVVEEIHVELGKFYDRENLEDTRLTSQMIKLVSDLFQQLNQSEPVKTQLETIEVLVSQKVDPRQMARILDWFVPGPNGEREPDTAKMMRELANPGSELTPERLAAIETRRNTYKRRGLDNRVIIEATTEEVREMVRGGMPLLDIVEASNWQKHRVQRLRGKMQPMNR